jgi:23S rRNA (cytidine1920-2'-O)/16S rRNA (cytidine1409-2'-O)-methyltransferase
MSDKQRLDLLLHQRGLAPSREKARAMIMAGEVTINDQVIDKPGAKVDVDAALTLRARPRFVSRGGDKLAAALDVFPVDVRRRICADVGASTGGFTDCLLQHGASKVYAIDVGYGQFDYALRQDSRVVVMERTNARYLEKLDEPVSLVVIDASFISLRLLLPVTLNWLTDVADVITLIKPQFEAGRKDVGKGGVVKSRATHQRVLHEVLSFATALSPDPLVPSGLIVSPLKGPAGNTEFLAWFRAGRMANADDRPDVSGVSMDVLIQSALDSATTQPAESEP